MVLAGLTGLIMVIPSSLFTFVKHIKLEILSAIAGFPDIGDNGRLLRVDLPDTDEKYALGDYLYQPSPHPITGCQSDPSHLRQTLPPPIGLV